MMGRRAPETSPGASPGADSTALKPTTPPTDTYRGVIAAPAQPAVNPPAADGRKIGSTPPVTSGKPVESSPVEAAGTKGPALVAKWMPQVLDFTEGKAQIAIDELEPVIDQLSGVTKGNGYYVLGWAYFKRSNQEDACKMWTAALPLVRSQQVDQMKEIFDQFCK